MALSEKKSDIPYPTYHNEFVEKGKRKTCILPHQQSLAKDLIWLHNNQKYYTSETSEIENNS
jgi:hypothetical protein